MLFSPLNFIVVAVAVYCIIVLKMAFWPVVFVAVTVNVIINLLSYVLFRITENKLC